MTDKQQLAEFNKTGGVHYPSNQKSVLANLKAQKESEERAFKQNARFRALEAAQYLHPRRNEVATTKTTEYDVVKKAEEIYQWLIKVLK